MTVKEPFPTQQLAILAICRLAEPIAFASILAYNYPFVQDIRGTREDAAFYAGLLVSAFALAEASTAVVWGTISDKVGRKPVVLSGLIGVALSSLGFGLAKNYWVALAVRALGGLLNGNVAVMQTMVSEMVKCPEHERTLLPLRSSIVRVVNRALTHSPALAYSMIPFMWFFGSIIGSSMGALLARPALLWPVLEGSLFSGYPYLLPNLVAAIWIMFAVILGALFLKETRVVTVENDVSVSDNTDETSPLLHRQRAELGASTPALAIETPSDHSVLYPDVPRSNGTHTLETASEQPIFQEPVQLPDTIAARKRNMVLLVLQLALVSYLQMAYGVLMPIYLVDFPYPDIPSGHLDLKGGFGFSVRKVGAVMSANGFMAIIVQGAIFTPFVRRFGVWKSFVWMTILAPLSYVVVPFITMAPRSRALIPIYMDLFAQNFMNIIVYPCLLILLKDSTPSASILGRVNGVAMTCCSGARTIAPPLVGYIYGVGGSAAAWWSIGLVALIAGLLIPTIKAPSCTPEVEGDGSD